MATRKAFKDSEKMILFGEVDGRCPHCGKNLMYKKNGTHNKIFEIAHIYPLNPKPNEIKILENVPRLSNNVNDLSNVIAVCRDCHTKFDKPRTSEEYMKWFNLKKRLETDFKIKSSFSLFNIEEAIVDVINKLCEFDWSDEIEKLSFQALTIDEKTNDDLSNLLKRKIRNNVVEHFNFIKDMFSEIDKTTPRKSEKIATQIKLIYLHFLEIDDNQNQIYEALVSWLKEKTKQDRTSCEIIIDYFVQNCEVFS